LGSSTSLLQGVLYRCRTFWLRRERRIVDAQLSVGYSHGVRVRRPVVSIRRGGAGPGGTSAAAGWRSRALGRTAL